MGQLNSQLQTKIGIDLVHMNRYQTLVENRAFVEKILSEKELEIFDGLTLEKRRLEFLCGRYACKEAYAKAMGTGIGALDFHDIEILKDPLGKPVCRNADVSISHDGDYAIAMVAVYE